MQKKKNTCNTSKLAILSTLIIFFLLVISNIFTFFILSFLYIANRLPTNGGTFSGFLFYLLLLSTLIGTMLSLIISHIPMKPVNRLINAMNELSNGNFDIYLKPVGPAGYRHLIENFNKMTKALGTTEMLRNDFINNFSHEFKTPIVSIRGFAKILKDNKLTDEERNEYLDIIISESTRLSSLANNVLNLSKIESQSIITQTSPFNLSEQIRKCILLLETHWESKNIDFDIDLAELTYDGNEELLTQVWLNLLDNAIKYSPENGLIRIRLTSAQDNLIFSITDHGCGIPPEKQPHIYDKFYQCDTSHSTAGNGLGLSVVKKVISLHHGNIVLSSTPDQGTTFTVFLPSSIS